MPHATPTVEDVTELGTVLSLVAPPEFEDGNGHVNVGHYYRLHMTGADAYFRELGFDDDYRERTGHSVFSIEHHIRFLDESLVGEELSVHLRLLGVGPKALHGQTIIVNRTRGTVANTLEFLELHVDLSTRRTTAMPEHLMPPLHAELERHRALPWMLPLSDTMGVR
ncbi:thioesterase family protein [Aeromicrobium sp. 179-A 4D2 NHS]|uniref:thioesterase family protein n=1 Tax=Aeromicrobium sp. 179-A 4D2 NHS TaxID=3142375 RepID=UPI00399EEAC5